MATSARPASQRFDPTVFQSFRFTRRSLSEDGVVSLGYALDDEHHFTERFRLPLRETLGSAQISAVEGLLALLHWTAGVSYFKTALPARVLCDSEAPGPAAKLLLEALYSEGLGELAFRNELPELPRPSFPLGQAHGDAQGLGEPRRILVPVGGGKDSAVAIEIARASGREVSLFSIGDAPPIVRTVEVAGLPRLIVRRELDPLLFELNAAGAINGHVPITAIVTCAALLTAALHDFDTVAMANERSASSGNLSWRGIEVNHQFSKSLRAERLLSAALAESGAPVRAFSLLRPASELAIARAFARLSQYHRAFTSCNAIFRLDPQLRASSWCCDCPKCRFVYLALAPFSEPAHLREVFGADLLADDAQYVGFALLAASGGHKPFECVGEEQESLAAMRLLAADERWRAHAVVARLASEVLPAHPLPEGEAETVLALGEDHDVPASLMEPVSALLGA